MAGELTATGAHLMAERREEAEAVAEPTLDQASPAAVAIALGRTSKVGKALDAKAEAFLERQTRLIDLQMHHLHEQERHMRLRYFGDRLKIGLQLLAILFGVTLVLAVALMAWRAHEDHGLTIAA